MPVYIKGNNKRRTKKFILSSRQVKSQLKKKEEVYAFSKFNFIIILDKLTISKFSYVMVHFILIQTAAKLFRFSKS